MKKKAILLLIIISFSLATVFAGTPVSNLDQDSKVSFETQVGYSTSTFKFKATREDASWRIDKAQNQGYSITEKVNINTGLCFDFTASTTFNYTSKAETTTNKSSYSDGHVLKSDVDSEDLQNSMVFFIGMMKSATIYKNLSATIGLGPDIIYLFERDDNSSYISYGIGGFANIDYKLTDSIKFTLGVNAYFNPYCYGDLVDDFSFYFSNDDTSTVTYSINPVIGVVYSW